MAIHNEFSNDYVSDLHFLKQFVSYYPFFGEVFNGAKKAGQSWNPTSGDTLKGFTTVRDKCNFEGMFTMLVVNTSLDENGKGAYLYDQNASVASPRYFIISDDFGNVDFWTCTGSDRYYFTSIGRFHVMKV